MKQDELDETIKVLKRTVDALAGVSNNVSRLAGAMEQLTGVIRDIDERVKRLEAA